MKKLMIAASAVAICCVANAASINWMSGDIAIGASPAGKETSQGELLNNNAGLWMFAITQSQYNYINNMVASDGSAAASAALWAGFTGNLTSWEEDGTWVMAGEGALKINGTDATPHYAYGMWGESTPLTEGWPAEMGDTAYAALVVGVDTDGDLKIDYYTADVRSVYVDNGYGVDVSNTGLAWDSGTATVWQAAAVPEPTSGLLLLLGVAGLALRRRRA